MRMLLVTMLATAACTPRRYETVAEYLRRQEGIRDEVWLHLTSPMEGSGPHIAIDLSTLHAKGTRRAMWAWHDDGVRNLYYRMFLECRDDTAQVLSVVSSRWDDAAVVMPGDVTLRPVVPGSWVSIVTTRVCEDGFARTAQTALDRVRALHDRSPADQSAELEALKKANLWVVLAPSKGGPASVDSAIPAEAATQQVSQGPPPM